MAPKIGTGEDYSCWDDGMARRKSGGGISTHPQNNIREKKIFYVDL